ncbi:MAG TPA: hypothetical protein VER39_11230 [Nocardioidaceae bacterium]|nr:hypothetical protein [Nocardioidaceae bacterium]
MNHLTASRLASVAAVGSITVLALAVPASALDDPTGGSGPVDVGAARNRVDNPTVDVRRLLNEVEVGRDRERWHGESNQLRDRDVTGSRPPAPASPAEGDGGPDLTLTLGALAGVVAAGGAVRLTVRRRHQARPARVRPASGTRATTDTP